MPQTATRDELNTLVAEILGRETRRIVLIDGYSGSGKAALARELVTLDGVISVSVSSYQLNGALDVRRMRKDVIKPFRRGRTIKGSLQGALNSESRDARLLLITGRGVGDSREPLSADQLWWCESNATQRAQRLGGTGNVPGATFNAIRQRLEQTETDQLRERMIGEADLIVMTDGMVDAAPSGDPLPDEQAVAEHGDGQEFPVAPASPDAANGTPVVAEDLVEAAGPADGAAPVAQSNGMAAPSTGMATQSEGIATPSEGMARPASPAAPAPAAAPPVEAMPPAPVAAAAPAVDPLLHGEGRSGTARVDRQAWDEIVLPDGVEEAPWETDAVGGPASAQAPIVDPSGDGFEVRAPSGPGRPIGRPRARWQPRVSRRSAQDDQAESARPVPGSVAFGRSLPARDEHLDGAGTQPDDQVAPASQASRAQDDFFPAEVDDRLTPQAAADAGLPGVVTPSFLAESARAPEALDPDAPLSAPESSVFTETALTADPDLMAEPDLQGAPQDEADVPVPPVAPAPAEAAHDVAEVPSSAAVDTPPPVATDFAEAAPPPDTAEPEASDPNAGSGRRLRIPGLSSLRRSATADVPVVPVVPQEELVEDLVDAGDQPADAEDPLPPTPEADGGFASDFDGAPTDAAPADDDGSELDLSDLESLDAELVEPSDSETAASELPDEELSDSTPDDSALTESGVSETAMSEAGLSEAESMADELPVTAEAPARVSQLPAWVANEVMTAPAVPVDAEFEPLLLEQSARTAVDTPDVLADPADRIFPDKPSKSPSDVVDIETGAGIGTQPENAAGNLLAALAELQGRADALDEPDADDDEASGAAVDPPERETTDGDVGDGGQASEGGAFSRLVDATATEPASTRRPDLTVVPDLLPDTPISDDDSATRSGLDTDDLDRADLDRADLDRPDLGGPAQISSQEPPAPDEPDDADFEPDGADFEVNDAGSVDYESDDAEPAASPSEDYTSPLTRRFADDYEPAEAARSSSADLGGSSDAEPGIVPESAMPVVASSASGQDRIGPDGTERLRQKLQSLVEILGSEAMVADFLEIEQTELRSWLIGRSRPRRASSALITDLAYFWDRLIASHEEASARSWLMSPNSTLADAVPIDYLRRYGPLQVMVALDVEEPRTAPDL